MPVTPISFMADLSASKRLCLVMISTFVILTDPAVRTGFSAGGVIKSGRGDAGTGC